MQDGSISPVRAFFRNKWVKLILCVDVILIVIAVVALVINTKKTSVIEFNIVPADSQILVNGKIYTNGTYHITPGVYDIQVSHSDLDTKTFTVDLQYSDMATIATFLHQGDNFDFYKLKENLNSFLDLAGMASVGYNQTTDQDTSAEAFIANFQKNYSLYSTELPIEYRESEGYGSNLSILKNVTIMAKHDCALTLCVQALMVGTDSREFINSLLKEKGFNVEDFEIDYKTY